MNPLIVIKHSKFEWDMKRFGLDANSMIDKYEEEHANIDPILAAHDHQVKMREQFQEVFNVQSSIRMDLLQSYGSLEKTPFKDVDMVIVLGGDNSFTCVSQLIGKTPILGINIDPDRSAGCLMQHKASNKDSIVKLRDSLEKGYAIELWTRLQANVDGIDITPATSEYFLGEKQRNYMSRHILTYQGKEYEQKCSGLLVATGAGSTGWYKSAIPLRDSFSKTIPSAAFVATESYSGRRHVTDGFFDYKEELTIHSLNDSEGIISVDSWNEVPFPRGSVAKIKIGTQLKVVCLFDV